MRRLLFERPCTSKSLCRWSSQAKKFTNTIRQENWLSQGRPHSWLRHWLCHSSSGLLPKSLDSASITPLWLSLSSFCAFLSTFLFTFLFTFLSISLSNYLTTFLSISLSSCLFTSLNRFFPTFTLTLDKIITWFSFQSLCPLSPTVIISVQIGLKFLLWKYTFVCQEVSLS